MTSASVFLTSVSSVPVLSSFSSLSTFLRVPSGLKVVCCCYFTNPKSWYPVPDRAASLFDIPLAPQLPPAVITPQDSPLMKGWTHTFGAAVRQRTVRQETTKARARTLPIFFFYQREIVPGESFRCCREIFIVLTKTGMRHVAVRWRRKSTSRTNQKAFPL